MSIPKNSHLVGYLVEPGSTLSTELTGTADINGVKEQHLLTLCAQPREPIDIGRSEDGDLVWVSEHNSADQGIPVLSDTPALVMTFDPPHREDDSVEVLTTTRRNFLHTLVNTLSQRRLLVLTSAVTGVILVFLGLVISGTPTNSTAASTDESSISPTSQIPKPDKVSEPTEAAIDFVLGGQVPGLTIPGDLTRDSLSATVVSTSGEIVLVDVQAEQPEGLTTFATLLLQKSGAAWRIREVFDPR